MVTLSAAPGAPFESQLSSFAQSHSAPPRSSVVCRYAVGGTITRAASSAIDVAVMDHDGGAKADASWIQGSRGCGPPKHWGSARSI